MPEITVGLPVRDAGRHLRSALLSLHNQTLTDWELVVMDDGSRDGAVDACADLLDDPRCTVHRSDTSRGLVAALNLFAAQASSALLARLDADDVMAPQRLARLVDHLSRHRAVDVVGSGAYVIDRGDRVVGRYRESPDTGDAARALDETPFVHPTVAGRTRWFLDHPYSERYLRAEDKELWLRTIATSTFAKLAEPLYFYRLDMTRSNAGYAAKLRSDRALFRRYGPAAVGRAAAARSIARTFAKGVVQAAGDRFVPVGRRLQQRRTVALTADELALAQQQWADAVGPVRP